MMRVLMAEAAEHGTTIVMSSHILTELEGACDYSSWSTADGSASAGRPTTSSPPTPS